MKTRNNKLIHVMISLLVISSGCNEESNVDNSPEIPGSHVNGNYIELGLSDSIIEVNSNPFEKDITTKISEFWIDGVELIVGSDTAIFKNELQPTYRKDGSFVNAPSKVMQGQDFYIEKSKKNDRLIKIRISENTSIGERKFLFWFGTNRNYSHKLTIIQEGKQ